MIINTFSDFCSILRKIGFAVSASNDEGIFNLNRYYSDKIRHHTWDPETDPWEWRIRSVTERDDIAYGKVFNSKGGWITKEWYPYFLAVRRNGYDLDDMYSDGLISVMERDVYNVIRESGEIAMYEIKRILNIGRELNSKYESALVKLQMKMFITVCGETHKTNKFGEPYGWGINVFTPVENFFGDIAFIDIDIATDKITERVREINPNASDKDINRFIGRV